MIGGIGIWKNEPIVLEKTKNETKNNLFLKRVTCKDWFECDDAQGWSQAVGELIPNIIDCLIPSSYYFTREGSWLTVSLCHLKSFLFTFLKWDVYQT